MKFLFSLFFLSLSIVLNAQDCNTSLLFKKGTEIEYKTYSPKGGLLSKDEFFEITKLIFIVEDVRDSIGAKYSFVTKIGINPNDEKIKYQKNYVIHCDGTKIKIPMDFYSVDTVYFSNVYPKTTREKGIYSSVTYKGSDAYVFPTDFEKYKFETTGNQISVNTKIRDYEMRFDQHGTPEKTARIVENTFPMDMNIKKKDYKGKEKISTPGGTFECYKIVIAAESEVLGRRLNTDMLLYYNAEVGLVKYEAQQSKFKSGYTELVSVKK